MPTELAGPTSRFADDLADRLGVVLAGEEFAGLLMVVRVARQGSFTFALYNNDVERAAVIDRLRTRLAPLPFFEFTIAADRPDPRRYLDGLTETQRRERAVVCINDIEAGFPDSLRYLDLQRAVFAAHPHVLVLWIKPETRGKAATEAPNFFSQHSGVFDLRLPPRRLDAETIRATPSANLITADVEEKQRSLALFESLLADYEAAPDADRATLLDLYLRIGKLRRGTSDNAGALRAFESAHALVDEETPDTVRAELNCRIGDANLSLSHHAQAAVAFEAALSIFNRIGSALGAARCIKGLGNIAFARSDDSAQARYEEALLLYRFVGDILGVANCVARLGEIAKASVDPDGARARFEEALPLYRRVGDVLGEANCIANLGDIALARSDHDGARARYEEALRLYDRIAEPYSIGWAHHRLARVARDDEERRRHVRAAREAWTSIRFDHQVDQLRAEFGELE